MVQEYQDHESGSKGDRAQCRQMPHNASTRKWDLLLFRALGRFSREATPATLKYLELLESHGVRWRSFTVAACLLCRLPELVDATAVANIFKFP